MAIDSLRLPSRAWEDLLSFAIGLLVTFFGRNFTYTILFSQTFPHSGWPKVHKGILGVLENVRRAHGAFYAELPELRDARSAAAQLVGRASVLLNAYFGASDETTEQVSAELAELQAEMRTVSRASSSIGSILAALEPGKLLALVRSIYDGIGRRSS